MASNKRWSYSTGDKGRNRVRAFENARTGVIYLEYFLKVNGRQKRKRKSRGHKDRRKAKQEAQELAVKLGRMAPQEVEASELTLQQLFDMYLGEVTPRKGKGKQKHDERAAKMFRQYFGKDRKVSKLKKRDGEAFIADRRAGNIAGRKAVKDRAVEYDLRSFLLPVLHWAVDNGLLKENPLRKLEIPDGEENAKRPVLTEQEYRKLLEVAEEAIGWRYKLALILAYETGHRGNAIRHLRWSDIDLKASSVHWRAQYDKQKREHTTPLSKPAVEALREALKARKAIGDALVLPSPSDPSQPCSRHLLRDWWERGVEAAGLEEVDQRGWHSIRRLFGTRNMHLPDKLQMALGGWKDMETVRKCYQEVTFEDMKAALAG